jgi:hypothetical protein
MTLEVFPAFVSVGSSQLESWTVSELSVLRRYRNDDGREEIIFAYRYGHFCLVSKPMLISFAELRLIF